jgi:hypothetical protein
MLIEMQLNVGLTLSGTHGFHQSQVNFDLHSQTDL